MCLRPTRSESISFCTHRRKSSSGLSERAVLRRLSRPLHAFHVCDPCRRGTPRARRSRLTGPTCRALIPLSFHTDTTAWAHQSISRRSRERSGTGLQKRDRHSPPPHGPRHGPSVPLICCDTAASSLLHWATNGRRKNKEQKHPILCALAAWAQRRAARVAPHARGGKGHGPRKSPRQNDSSSGPSSVTRRSRRRLLK